MDIFGYFLTASVTLVGSVIVALAVTKVEDLYLEWKYGSWPYTARDLFPLPKEDEGDELIVHESHEE